MTHEDARNLIEAVRWLAGAVLFAAVWLGWDLSRIAGAIVKGARQ